MDQFEEVVNVAGKSGSVQAFALVESITKTIDNYVPNNVLPHTVKDGTYRDGFIAAFEALHELTSILLAHAKEQPAYAIRKGDDVIVVHLQPNIIQADFVRVLREKLMKE